MLQVFWTYPLPLTIMQQVKYWYNNHARREVAPPQFNKPRKISLNQVLSRDYKAEIKVIASKLAIGAPSGSRAHFGSWTRATETFKAKMSAAEKVRMTWAEISPPADVQSINATKYGRKTVEEVVERQYKTLGMRSLTWEFHYNMDGNTLFSLSVYALLCEADPDIPPGMILTRPLAELLGSNRSNNCSLRHMRLFNKLLLTT